MGLAWATIFGLAVNIPLTSDQISSASESVAAAMSAAE